MKKTIKTSKSKRQQLCHASQVAQPVLPASLGWTVGIDLGDKESHYCILNQGGDTISRGKVATTKSGLRSVFAGMPQSRLALEVGTHSPWTSRYLSQMGHEVIVANPRQVKLIGRGGRKNDRIDAERLARLARMDVKLLYPIQHRGEQAQADLLVIRARAGLMKARTMLASKARGLVKSLGERLKPCDVDQMSGEMAAGLSAEAAWAVQGLLSSVTELSRQIEGYDREIEQIEKRYPEVELLKQVYGVGVLVGLTFILTLEDPHRFRHSRDVGPLLGLVPQQHDSGEHQPELRITKAGDGLLRSLLVQGAHCIIRKGAPESDLQRWAAEHQGKSGKGRKKKVVVAVARKLAVLLHHLWVSGEVYDPHYNQKLKERRQKTAA